MVFAKKANDHRFAPFIARLYLNFFALPGADFFSAMRLRTEQIIATSGGKGQLGSQPRFTGIPLRWFSASIIE